MLPGVRRVENVTPPSPVVVTTASGVDNDTTSLWLFGEVEDTVLLPMLLSFIAIWCVIGNAIVIYSVLANRSMRTGFNLMLLNISACDLVFILLTVPTATVNHASYGRLTELPGVEICKFVHYITFVTVYVAVYTLVVMCVFCFCGEFMSDKGKTVSYLSRGNAVMSCFVIWIAFLLSHLNFLIQPDVAIFQEPFICLHSDALMEPMKLRTLWVTFLTCGFLLPLISIVLLSVFVLRKQHTDDTVLHLRRHGYYENVSVNVTSQAELAPRRKKTVVIMTAMVARILCWLPLQVFVMIDIFGYSPSDMFYRKAEMLSVCVAFVGACVNPTVYYYAYTELSNAIKETLVRFGCGRCVTLTAEDEHSDMNETVMSIISDSTNQINQQHMF